MLFALSPAKNLNEQKDTLTRPHSQPDFLEHAAELMQALRRLAPQDIAALMHVSDKIALLNTERNAAWQPPFTPDNAKQAVYLFNGDVYEGLQADTLSDQATDYLQQHTRILSGLYGLLRPLDLIQPYRLEMGTPLANSRGKNLYEFWEQRLSQHLQQELAADSTPPTLINLASQEYFKALPTQALNARIITPVFKDQKNGQYKVISFYAKRARGLMMRYAAEHHLQHPDDLQQFDSEGYAFNAAASSENEWVFLRAEQP